MRRLFPVGLYATVLLAFLVLLRPSAVSRVERALQSAASLPFRAVVAVAPRFADAAVESAPAMAKRSLQRSKLFWQRVLRGERAGRPAAVRVAAEPVVCRVVALRGRGSRLVLDSSALDLGPGRLARYATLSDQLVGFVDLPAADERSADSAVPASWSKPLEVVLLDARDARHAASRRVPAVSVMPTGQPLRFVVEPAASIDPWPLRCTLIDDPYLAATLRQDGQPVLTRAFPEDPLGAVPAGLRIGSLRIWGYQRSEGDSVPIGYFVEPPAEAVRSPVVTLWRRPADATGEGSDAPRDENPSEAVAGGQTRIDRVPLRAIELHDGRWFASVPFDAGALPVGSAVVRDRLYVGTVSSAGPGFALIRPFGIAGARWSGHFVTVGEDAGGEGGRAAAGATGTCTGEVVRATSEGLMLQLDEDDDGADALVDGAQGALFTSAVEGVPGLWLGDVLVRSGGSVGGEVGVEREGGIVELWRGADAGQPGRMQALVVKVGSGSGAR